MLQEDQSVCNYRHSHPRHVIENTFDILLTRWRNFHTPINASVEIVEKYVKAAVLLHNYLRPTENADYCPSGFIDSEDFSGNIQTDYWRESFQFNSQAPLSKLQRAWILIYRTCSCNERWLEGLC